MGWLEDQRRFDDTGEQPDWRSQDPWVPASYRLDLEFVCFTNAANLAALVPELAYVEGQCRFAGDESRDAWGEHAWCVAPDGRVVDPYFEWKFPGEHLEYRPAD